MTRPPRMTPVPLIPPARRRTAPDVWILVSCPAYS